MYIKENSDGTVTAVQTVDLPSKDFKVEDLPPPPPPTVADVYLHAMPGPVAGSTPMGSSGGDQGIPGSGPNPSISQLLAAGLPLSPGQRGPKEQAQQSGSVVVALKLASQLASSPEFLVRQMIDERKLAVLNDLVATALNYFSFRGYVDGVRFYQWVVDAELVTSQAIDGLARRHILRAIEASSGSQVTEVAKKPGILERNLWGRDWKRKAERSGKYVPENEGAE